MSYIRIIKYPDGSARGKIFDTKDQFDEWFAEDGRVTAGAVVVPGKLNKDKTITEA